MEPSISEANKLLDKFDKSLRKGLSLYIKKTLKNVMRFDILSVWLCIGRFWVDTWKMHFHDNNLLLPSRTKEEWLDMREKFIRQHYNEYYTGWEPVDGGKWNFAEIHLNYTRCQHCFGGILLNRDKDRMMVIEPNKKIYGENFECKQRMRSGDWNFPNGKRQVYRYYKHEMPEINDNAAIREVHEKTGIDESLLRTYLIHKNSIKFTPFFDEVELFVIHFHDLTDCQLPEPAGWDKLEVYQAQWIDTNHVLKKLKDRKVGGGYHWEIRTGVMRRLMASCLQTEAFLNTVLVYHPEEYIFKRSDIPDMPSKFHSGFQVLYGEISDYNKKPLVTNRQPWQVDESNADAEVKSHWAARAPVSHHFRHAKPKPCCALIDDDDSLHDVLTPLLSVDCKDSCGKNRDKTASGGSSRFRSCVVKKPDAEHESPTKDKPMAEQWTTDTSTYHSSTDADGQWSLVTNAPVCLITEGGSVSATTGTPASLTGEQKDISECPISTMVSTDEKEQEKTQTLTSLKTPSDGQPSSSFSSSFVPPRSFRLRVRINEEENVSDSASTQSPIKERKLDRRFG